MFMNTLSLPFSAFRCFGGGFSTFERGRWVLFGLGVVRVSFRTSDPAFVYTVAVGMVVWRTTPKLWLGIGEVLCSRGQASERAEGGGFFRLGVSGGPRGAGSARRGPR